MSAAPLWAKIDSGFFGNRKILRAGRNGRDVFLAVLLMNTARGSTGSIPSADLEPWYLARYLGIAEAEVQDGINRAITADLISLRDGVVSIVGWDQEWARRPKTDAERSKSYRNRHAVNVTRHGESESSRIDREIDRERDPRDAAGSLSQGSIRSAKDKRVSDEAQTLPASWEPSAEAISMASTLGLDVTHEAANFRDHHADKGTLIRDADALFRKWLRGSKDKGKHKPPKAGATTTKPRTYRTTTVLGTVIEYDENGEPIGRNGVKQHDGDSPKENK